MRRFDVVLLDLVMPVVAGWDLARRVPHYPCRPFLIAVTGCVAAAVRREAIEAGIDLILDKPTDVAILAGILDRLGRFLRATTE